MIWTNKYCWIHSVTHTSKRGKILILYMAINNILQYMAILQRSGFFLHKGDKMPTQWYLNSCCERGKWEDSSMQNRVIKSGNFDFRVHFVVTFANYVNGFLRWPLLALASRITKYQALTRPHTTRNWNRITTVR